MTADLTPTERVRLAMTLLTPLAEAAKAEAQHAALVFAFCLNDARGANAPSDICAEAKEAHLAVMWQRDRLASALADLDGWLQAMAAESEAAA